MNTHCRVGRVVLKASPHLAVLPFRPNKTDLHKTLKSQTEQLIKIIPDMAGYAVVAWDFDGWFSRAAHTHPESPIGTTLMPSFVAEVLRRDTMTNVVLQNIEDYL